MHLLVFFCFCSPGTFAWLCAFFPIVPRNYLTLPYPYLKSFHWLLLSSSSCSQVPAIRCVFLLHPSWSPHLDVISPLQLPRRQEREKNASRGSGGVPSTSSTHTLQLLCAGSGYTIAPPWSNTGYQKVLDSLSCLVSSGANS